MIRNYDKLIFELSKEGRTGYSLPKNVFKENYCPCRLPAALKRESKPLSELTAIMTRYPQHMVNLPVSPEGKLEFYTDPEIRNAIDLAREKLGERGRVVVRPSGTEPLIRIMAESDDEDLTREAVDIVARAIAERLNK